MRLIFFSFKHRYRQKELNNFLNTRIYGKYFILNLGGPFKHFIAKILLFLRIGKAISCDGRPLIADKSRGINFWMRGTSLNIPSNLKNLNNNFVTINNSLFQEKKVFQIYPINIKKTQIQDDLKIIYVSRVSIETNLEEKNIWEKYKTQLIEDFSLIDNIKFFEKILFLKENLCFFNDCSIRLILTISVPIPKIFIYVLITFLNLLIALFNPQNKDSEIRKCPILNSEMFLILDILKADLYVSPCPACTCRPIFFA